MMTLKDAIHSSHEDGVEIDGCLFSSWFEDGRRIYEIFNRKTWNVLLSTYDGSEFIDRLKMAYSNAKEVTA